MGFSHFFSTSSFPWLFFSALFFGAALSRAVRFARHDDNIERFKTKKWVFFSLYFSLSIVFFLCALFIPGAEKIKDIRLLYFFCVCFVLSFLAFRFKKSLGLVLFILIIVLAAVILLFIQALTAFTGETEIGQIRVIDIEADENVMKLEIIPGGGEPVFREMEGSYFAPVVKVIIFDDYLVFLGTRTWYRFEGISSFAVEKQGSKQIFRQQNTDYYFPFPFGITEGLWQFYEKYEQKIPGVRTVQIEMDLKRARALSTYSIRVQNDGGIQILKIN